MAFGVLVGFGIVCWVTGPCVLVSVGHLGHSWVAYCETKNSSSVGQMVSLNLPMTLCVQSYRVCDFSMYTTP